MNQGFVIFSVIFQVNIIPCVKPNQPIAYSNQNNIGYDFNNFNHLVGLEHPQKYIICALNYNMDRCYLTHINIPNKSNSIITQNSNHIHHRHRANHVSETQPLLQKLVISRPNSAVNRLRERIHSNLFHPFFRPNHIAPNIGFLPVDRMMPNNYLQNYYKPPPAPDIAENTNAPQPMIPNQTVTQSSVEKFKRNLEQFEGHFYMVTFNKLTSLSPPDRQVNGMSFVQSAFFLQLTLMALSLELDSVAKAQIEKSIGFQISETETINLIKEMMECLPGSSHHLRFQRSSRLLLWPGQQVSPKFRAGAAAALQLATDSFNGTENALDITTILNRKIEEDSGGAIRDTFDEEDVSEGVTAVLINMLYFRVRWRYDPTVLNGTMEFRDAGDAPARRVRMIRLNGVMGYVDIKQWNAQALEIPYAVPDLSLVIVVPRTPYLKPLAEHVSNTSVSNITAAMRQVRLAATIPLYTLRMTLLVPNKLEEMGVSHLFDASNLRPGGPLRLSHMVQRLMFWAEAGRHAYKDDGLQWGEPPQMEIMIDRPYIFFVRWRNITIMNGNFVL